LPVELYYAPKDDNAPLPTLTEVQQRFAAAGLPCTIEAEEGASDMWWLIFEPLSTTLICASTKNDRFVFATVQSPFDDDPAYLEKIDQVLEGIGFLGDPGE